MSIEANKSIIRTFALKSHPKWKKGKLLNTLLRNKEKKSTTNKSTAGATTKADDDESDEDKVVEAVPVGKQSTDHNTSNYIPVDIHTIRRRPLRIWLKGTWITTAIPTHKTGLWSSYQKENRL